LRPIGQFDLSDDDQGSVVGGELGILEALTADGSDAYASDAVVVGTSSSSNIGYRNYTLMLDGAKLISGLIDEGNSGEGEYGTLFGSVIGGTAGQGTGKGTLSTTGVVTVGPRTHFWFW
jgi:hypothetical protein